MGNYEQLKQAVSDVIKTNGNQEITGAILQNTLLSIISTLGSNVTFAGIAYPNTNPGTPDQNVFYLAYQRGTYSNFNGYEVVDNVTIFNNENGNWVAIQLGIPTSTKAKDLELKGSFYADIPTEGNLIDPNKVVNGYYFGNDGALNQNEDYGYTYIPMRGKNITINYGGGFKLSACDKYGSVTHTNDYPANYNVLSKTIIYQDGDEYAMVSVDLGSLGKSASAEYGNEPQYYKPYNEQYGNLIKENSISPRKLNDDIIIKKNLLNTSDVDYLKGYYLSEQNILIENENYAVSGYIPFTEEMEYMVMSRDGITITVGGGGVGLYDIYKNPIIIEQNQNIDGVVTWQENVAFVRYSIPDYKNGNIQIEVGNIPTEYSPYSGMLNPNILPKDKNIEIVLSTIGNNADKKSIDSLNNGEISTIDTFPMHLKKRLIMSFETMINTFSEVIIGKGYQQYRGDYLKIDDTNITLLHYEQSESQVETVAHGISIETFIKVSMYADNSGYLYVILQSKNGMFKYIFKGWGYEANYQPFVKSVNSSLSLLKLNVGCQDFKNPVWAFGDSYFGVASNRWVGVMRDFGFFNFLIDGLAGQNSNGAYSDLLKCLNFGTPKYLIWCLGMNDQDNTYKVVFDKVKSICEQKGITMIAATIPSVPARSKEVINQYVIESGLRYIDFKKAVGANELGVWYQGYLSSDEVHPTDLGAQALATQVLIDFPELMQYGIVSTESEIGNITGDN